MLLPRHIVEKTWGVDSPPAWVDVATDTRVGEIWFDSDADDPSAQHAALPLLIKYILTSQKLSVQVHPGNAEAAERGLSGGKSEGWFILSAEPEATVGIGTTKPLSDAELRAAAIDGTVESLMDWQPVKAGDYIYIPSGTVHAIGPGITLVEVQPHVDVTYRLYDYGRPRELHLDDGVAVAHARPFDAQNRVDSVNGCVKLPSGDDFQLWHMAGAVDHALLAEAGAEAGGGPYFCVALTDGVTIGGGTLSPGQCALIDDPSVLRLEEKARLLIARR